MATLEGRTAVVTGGTRGIGSAIAERLAADGAHVAMTYRSAEGPARALLARMEANGWSASIHRSDVGDPQACRRLVADVLATRGRIDHLVNNAGITLVSAVRRMTPEQWDTVLRVNLSGVFYLCHAALDSMIEHRFGRIVNIGSVTAATGVAGGANYAAAKSGLLGFTKSLALEVAHRGITVNVVSPGFIETDLIDFMEGEQIDEVIRRVPVGRLGRPDEIARAVSFLLDEDAGFITGTELAVNGGLDM